ncbi:hypothetical protein [Corynebacterium sp. HMSC055A01]|nr:hypothetical protein [Corynebacterium sp. HMSC055A01]
MVEGPQAASNMTTGLGCHHHVTLVTAAHLSATGQRLADDLAPQAPEAG